MDPKRERGRGSCCDGRRETPTPEGDIGATLGLTAAPDEARRGAGAPDARGLRGLGSFIDGLREFAADRTAGVGGPS